MEHGHTLNNIMTYAFYMGSPISFLAFEESRILHMTSIHLCIPLLVNIINVLQR